jgi:hypothetical protein
MTIEVRPQITVTRKLAAALRKYKAAKNDPDDSAMEVFNYGGTQVLLEAVEVAECLLAVVDVK